MTQESFPAGRLRVGHAEREAVAEILQEAAADGRLDMDELDQRLEVALQARTYADHEQLITDLSTDPARSATASGWCRRSCGSAQGWAR